MSQAQVFEAFNEQLACMAEAGVPLEEGLRLIAKETRSRRARGAIAAILADLNRGENLSQAFARQTGVFPDVYHRVIDVGIRSGKLSHVLVAFGRHLALIERMKRQLWQSLAYPVVCLIVLLVVAVLLSIGPIPVLANMADPTQPQIYTGRWNEPPPADLSFAPLRIRAVMLFAELVPWVAGAILLALILMPLAWYGLGLARAQAAVTDAILSRVPMLGPVLRQSALAQWCNAVAISTEAGMELSGAIEMAGDLVGWPTIALDSKEMAQALRQGGTLALAEDGSWRRIPPATRQTMQFAVEKQDLPRTARTLANMHEQQAQQRATALNAVLAPAMLLVIALMVASVLGAIMIPIVRLLNSLMSPF